MKLTIVMGKSRRIVLPKDVCRRLQLEEGDSLEVMVEGDCLKLRPRPDEQVNLVREGGLLVATGYPSGADIGAAVLADREDREEQLTDVYRTGSQKLAK
jgi:AbrB family looped-hinge helix DNA binding protein